MRGNILSTCTTVVVCLAGVLLYDRLLPFTYPATVTVPMLLIHYVNKSAFGIILAFLIRKRYALPKYLCYALLISLIPATVETLIGFPMDKTMPKGLFLHDLLLTFASMIMFMIFSRPTPPAVQGS